jgi:hypothetical protein
MWTDLALWSGDPQLYGERSGWRNAGGSGKSKGKMKLWRVDLFVLRSWAVRLMLWLNVVAGLVNIRDGHWAIGLGCLLFGLSLYLSLFLKVSHAAGDVQGSGMGSSGRKGVPAERTAAAAFATSCCEEHDRLLTEFGSAVQEFLTLHEKQFLATVNGDCECSRYDRLIHTAYENKQRARCAYVQHMKAHRRSSVG